MMGCQPIRHDLYCLLVVLDSAFHFSQSPMSQPKVIIGFPKVGIISGTGDRRDEDLIELGKVGAEIFDEIIIRQDAQLRGRTPKEILVLLMKGIRKVDKKKPVMVVHNEKKAIISSIQEAKKGAFITVISDAIPEAIKLIRELKEKEAKVTVLKADIPNLD